MGTRLPNELCFWTLSYPKRTSFSGSVPSFLSSFILSLSPPFLSPIHPPLFFVRSVREVVWPALKKSERTRMEWLLEKRKKKKETKMRKECWWFNQGSALSIRHCTDGERASERHTWTETKWGERAREREWEEVNERDERKLKKNDWGNITGLEEQGKGGRAGGQAEGN